jgi:hypothetical protein
MKYCAKWHLIYGKVGSVSLQFKQMGGWWCWCLTVERKNKVFVFTAGSAWKEPSSLCCQSPAEFAFGKSRVVLSLLCSDAPRTFRALMCFLARGIRHQPIYMPLLYSFVVVLRGNHPAHQRELGEFVDSICAARKLACSGNWQLFILWFWSSYLQYKKHPVLSRFAFCIITHPSLP